MAFNDLKTSTNVCEVEALLGHPIPMTANGIADTAPIAQQYNELGKSLSVLGDELRQLEARLSPVLSPECRAEKGEQDSGAKRLESPMTSSIRRDVESVQALIESIQSIQARLEV